ncbi:hypothetical protein NQ176_g3603 [Zarea fungicola]|uniref:Uncharacterized protein n=1 Tax=Zarea fungicola TaxID=93591 RepID=A0ACC1NIQ1_9HYPO|nr:hypothetical protein NQ176_g3603 [Lecanicillium fungicola]
MTLYNWSHQLAYWLWRTRRLEQKPDCHIVAMPPNVMLLIADQLALWEQYQLSQTCFAIRSAVVDHFRQAALYNQSVEDRIEYLSRRAYDLPGYWVCEKCIDLHTVSPLDCPTLPGTCWRPGAHYKSAHFQLGCFRVSHRHLQLALKWTRMKDLRPEYKENLKLLLKWGYFDIPPPLPGTALGPRAPGTGYYWQQPRVIQGRFMVTTGQVFYPDKKGELGRDDLNTIPMCQHQEWEPRVLRKIDQVRALPPGEMTPRESRLLQLSLWLEECDLGKAMTELLRTRGAEFSVSCPSCATDITVSIHREGRPRMEFTCWHDFGPESSPLDACWRAKHFPVRVDGLPVHRPMPPGGVRKLWESHAEYGIASKW